MLDNRFIMSVADNTSSAEISAVVSGVLCSNGRSPLLFQMTSVNWREPQLNTQAGRKGQMEQGYRDREQCHTSTT